MAGPSFDMRREILESPLAVAVLGLLADPLGPILSFYAMIEQVATERGINPDAPRHLKKVTQTT